jgi:hypothetical protein
MAPSWAFKSCVWQQQSMWDENELGEFLLEMRGNEWRMKGHLCLQIASRLFPIPLIIICCCFSPWQKVHRGCTVNWPNSQKKSTIVVLSIPFRQFALDNLSHFIPNIFKYFLIKNVLILAQGKLGHFLHSYFGKQVNQDNKIMTNHNHPSSFVMNWMNSSRIYDQKIWLTCKKYIFGW